VGGEGTSREELSEPEREVTGLGDFGAQPARGREVDIGRKKKPLGCLK